VREFGGWSARTASIHTTCAAHLIQDMPAPLTPPALQPGSTRKDATCTRSSRGSGFDFFYRSSTQTEPDTREAPRAHLGTPLRSG
jgi:hypothetical protein